MGLAPSLDPRDVVLAAEVIRVLFAPLGLTVGFAGEAAGWLITEALMPAVAPVGHEQLFAVKTDALRTRIAHDPRAKPPVGTTEENAEAEEDAARKKEEQFCGEAGKKTPPEEDPISNRRFHASFISPLAGVCSANQESRGCRGRDERIPARAPGAGREDEHSHHEVPTRFGLGVTLRICQVGLMRCTVLWILCGLCRTYNPHPLGKMGQTPREPVFTGVERVLTICC